jgi:hypothetical protein
VITSVLRGFSVVSFMVCCYSLEGGKVFHNHFRDVTNMVRVLYGGIVAVNHKNLPPPKILNFLYIHCRRGLYRPFSQRFYPPPPYPLLPVTLRNCHGAETSHPVTDSQLLATVA